MLKIQFIPALKSHNVYSSHVFLIKVGTLSFHELVINDFCLIIRPPNEDMRMLIQSKQFARTSTHTNIRKCISLQSFLIIYVQRNKHVRLYVCYYCQRSYRYPVTAAVAPVSTARCVCVVVFPFVQVTFAFRLVYTYYYVSYIWRLAHLEMNTRAKLRKEEKRRMHTYIYIYTYVRVSAVVGSFSIQNFRWGAHLATDSWYTERLSFYYASLGQQCVFSCQPRIKINGSMECFRVHCRSELNQSDRVIDFVIAVSKIFRFPWRYRS